MNQTLSSRIQAIFNALNAYSAGGQFTSSASKGIEREIFINTLLSSVFPPHYRFTSGDIVDSVGHQTGQVDIVLEKPRGFSFPLAYEGPRLFLAEDVAAVIEVKSDLCDQWEEVTATAVKLASIKPVHSSERWMQRLTELMDGEVKLPESIDREKYENSIIKELNRPGNWGNNRIPFIAVGFAGWKKHLRQFQNWWIIKSTEYS